MNKSANNTEGQLHFMLMENHDSAFHAWKALSFRAETAVHIDAHLDILTDSTNNIHFGNYLFQAIKDGIVKKLYWIVPGTRNQFIADLIYLKKILSSLGAHNHISPPAGTQKTVFAKGVLSTTLFDIPIHICTLEDVPSMKEAVLLDIDIDFFIIDRVRNNSNIQNVGERKPWIGVDTFVGTIKKKIPSKRFTTIAYSVNEGYTPLKYKTLGDTIAAKLGFADEGTKTRLSAGAHFARFRTQFDKKQLKEAKKSLIAAMYLNPLYAVPENTYGGLFLKKRDLKGAYGEFSKMLKINGEDKYSLIGLGIVNLYKNNLQRARVFFKKVVALDPSNERALLYHAWTEYRMHHYSEADQLCKEGARLNSKNFYFAYLQGKLAERKGKNDEAALLFQKAAQTGALSEIPLGLELLMD